jgi:hypothetical protein
LDFAGAVKYMNVFPEQRVVAGHDVSLTISRKSFNSTVSGVPIGYR